MDNVDCTGTETEITDCTFNGWGIHNCRHREDVGVNCTARTLPSKLQFVLLVSGLLCLGTLCLTCGDNQVLVYGMMAVAGGSV